MLAMDVLAKALSLSDIVLGDDLLTSSSDINVDHMQCNITESLNSISAANPQASQVYLNNSSGPPYSKQNISIGTRLTDVPCNTMTIAVNPNVRNGTPTIQYLSPKRTNICLKSKVPLETNKVQSTNPVILSSPQSPCVHPGNSVCLPSSKSFSNKINHSSICHNGIKATNTNPSGNRSPTIQYLNSKKENMRLLKQNAFSERTVMKSPNASRQALHVHPNNVFNTPSPCQTLSSVSQPDVSLNFMTSVKSPNTIRKVSTVEYLVSKNENTCFSDQKTLPKVTKVNTSPKARSMPSLQTLFLNPVNVSSQFSPNLTNPPNHSGEAAREKAACAIADRNVEIQYLSRGKSKCLPVEMAIPKVMGEICPKINKINNEEPEEEEEEELGHSQTYADYMPSKLNFGQRHPDPVVETSSLSSVIPPDIWYTLSIPEKTIDLGLLSALQLEAITYACQQHENFLPDGTTRTGFLIGDGAGVGKGRTIAGIIYENYLLERKRALWVSISSDLKYDCERDLKDIGAEKIGVYALNKLRYEKISSKCNGKIKKGVIFATYSSLIGESHLKVGTFRSRYDQLIQWCGDDFDGVIIFDECHKAKNLYTSGSVKPSKTGQVVLKLQTELPKARVVYASATGASELKNMAYMARLGLWGEGSPFKEFKDFINVVEKRGVGAMEILSMDLKLRGVYIARQLSFSGVSFNIREIKLKEDFISVYNKCVELWFKALSMFHEAADLMEGDARIKSSMECQFWASHQRFFRYLCNASKVPDVVKMTREAIKNGKCVVIGLQTTGEAKTLEHVEENGVELTDFISTAKGVFQSLVEKHFPAPDRKKSLRILGLEIGNQEPSTSKGKKRKLCQSREGNHKKRQHTSESSSEENMLGGGRDSESSDSEEYDEEGMNLSCSESNEESFVVDSDDEDPWINGIFGNINFGTRKRKKVLRRKKSMSPVRTPQFDPFEKVCKMKAELLSRIEELDSILPPNTLDQLIDELGGPENVAEMTGRKGRVIINDGCVKYESRSGADVSLELLNMEEKRRFMNGEKLIAIISEAASSGISLQSDRRCKNQARRVHITLELPWSAEKVVQQFGRTHRSNQVNAPEYEFIISNLAGERRFAAIVAKRLESLGALTHGDRRATESRDLSQFNIDTKFGRTALERMMRGMMGLETSLVPPPENYEGNFFHDVRRALVGVALILEDPVTKEQVLDKDHNNIAKFLNRILGINFELQNLLFQYFTDTLKVVLQQAKKTGRFDHGILDIGSSNGAKKIKCNSFTRRYSTGDAVTELHTVRIERGVKWEEVFRKLDYHSDRDGFYLSLQLRNERRAAILAVSNNGKFSRDKNNTFSIYRPNTGLQVKHETLHQIKSKYYKASKEEAESHWKKHFDASEQFCSHFYWYGHCKNKTLGLDCEIGLRKRTYYVLSGSVLSIWSMIENVLSSIQGFCNTKLQVVRVRTEDGARIVGCLIPSIAVPKLISVLSAGATKVDEKKFLT